MTSSLSDRSQYPCLRDSVYLNQASLGLIGQPAVAAMHSFLENVARHGNLSMSELMSYQWLPTEGRDFVVRYDRATANGVAIESEVFYPA
jgi:hypothetical protein